MINPGTRPKSLKFLVTSMSRLAKAIDAIRRSIVPISNALSEKPIKKCSSRRVEGQDRDGRVVTQQASEHSVPSDDLGGRRRPRDVGVTAKNLFVEAHNGECQI